MFDRAIITDLDGTLLKNNHTFNDLDLDCLVRIKKLRILRVIATGRSLFSASKVIKRNFPIDYLICSSGAGIINWTTKKLELKYSYKDNDAKKIFHYLIDHKFDFFVQKKLPDNHYFDYFVFDSGNTDFFERIRLYKEFSNSGLDYECYNPSGISQFIVVCKESHGKKKFLQLRQKFSEYSVIRATSPLDHCSVWIEIFPSEVSKSKASCWLMDKYNIPLNNTVSLGNDYNDEDLLRWSHHSFVVENAPSFLKDRYCVVSTNENGGFCEVCTLLEENRLKSF